MFYGLFSFFMRVFVSSRTGIKEEQNEGKRGGEFNDQSRDVSAGTETRPGADRPMNCALIPNKNKTFFSSSKRPNRPPFSIARTLLTSI
jgi:hypothetical protein